MRLFEIQNNILMYLFSYSINFKQKIECLLFSPLLACHKGPLSQEPSVWTEKEASVQQ